MGPAGASRQRRRRPRRPCPLLSASLSLCRVPLALAAAAAASISTTTATITPIRAWDHYSESLALRRVGRGGSRVYALVGVHWICFGRGSGN
jgi:hypothetical protein